MYECLKCGNREHFIEYNCVKTEVTIDEKTGKITGSHVTFLEREDVQCGLCKDLMSAGRIKEVQ